MASFCWSMPTVRQVFGLSDQPHYAVVVVLKAQVK